MRLGCLPPVAVAIQSARTSIARQAESAAIFVPLVTGLLLGIAASVQAQSGRAYEPTEFIIGDGGNGNNWKSLGDYQAWWNGRAEGRFAECMAKPKQRGYGWSCTKITITGFDPYQGVPWEIYFNGHAYWSWVRANNYYIGTPSEGYEPVQSISRDLSINGDSSGLWAAYANPVCPARMNRQDTLNDGGPGKQYRVVCIDTQELACPKCRDGSAADMAAPPLFGNPINPANSTKYQAETDYVAEGGRLSLARHYHSSAQQWADSIPQLLDFTSQRPASFPSVRRSFLLSANGQTYLPLEFKLVSLNPLGEVQVMRANGVRVVLPETSPGLFASADKTTTAIRNTLPSGSWEWQFRSPDNKLETFDADGRPTSVVRHDGHTVLYTYPAAGRVDITSGQSGRVLSLAYGSDGALATAQVPGGGLVAYSSVSRLYDSVTYPDGTQKRYMYDEPGHVASTSPFRGMLTGIIDERGVRGSTYRYNASGEAVSTELAGGVNRYATSGYGTYSSLVDPLGTTMYLYWYTAPDGAKRLQRISQAAGSGSASSSTNFTYAADGSLTSVDDFNGKRTCFSSDMTRNLEVVRVEGVANSISCGGVLATNAALPAGGRKTSVQWHPEWRLKTREAGAGKLTTWVYNGQPDPLNSNSISSCAPADALLPDGKPIAVLCKRVEQATNDSNGSQGFAASLQANVPARQSTWTYNRFGQALTVRGPRTDVDDTTSYAYYADTSDDHSRGDLSHVINALGKIARFTKYNAHGQILESTDPNGLTTTYTYDARQRLTSESKGDQITRFDYDAAGRLRDLTLPDTTVIRYAYDDAGRLVRITDAAGNIVTYTLDNAGNREGEQVMDPGGTLARNIGRAFDALGRLQAITGAMQ